jgi:hypothetical protein
LCAYCRGGYFNFLQQPHFPPPPHQTGENFHFVGLTKNFNPSSPAPTPQTDKVSIDIDIDDGDEETRPVKKRYWAHDEKVRLVNTIDCHGFYMIFAIQI